MENTDSSLPPSPTETPPQKNSKLWLNLLVLLIVLSVLAAGAIYLQKKTLPQDQGNNNPPQVENPNDELPDEPLVSAAVEWRYPQQTFIDIVNSNVANANSGITFYNVGTFKEGTHMGSGLVVAIIPPNCPCAPIILRFAVKETPEGGVTLRVLANHSDPLDNLNPEVIDSSKFSVDSGTSIPDLKIPESLTAPNGQRLAVATPSPFRPSYNIFNSTNLVPVFFDPQVGQVYTSPEDTAQVDSFFASNGFYVKQPDWNTQVYRIAVDFVGTDNVPKVTWNNNSVNDDEYIYVNVGGCGSVDYAAVENDISISRDLNPTGKNSSGQTVYEFKDPQHAMLRAMYNDDYHPFDPQTGQTKDELKVPYDQFTASHPIFFWEDAFGRLIKFKNKTFIVSNAECGKPVIYLYPTTAQNVRVEVSLEGGFSFTEPDYGTGWDVFATPQGQLTNLADNKQYPYLFWEGRGGLYEMPDKGFVVSQKEVSKFFDQKLAQHGLSAQEIADFKEYWLPFFEGSPYYFITFMGNSIMDRIAPLSISPKPDTVIRVLMDFKPLTRYMEVEGYDISTPVRKGFTVVEWGGVRP